MSGAAVALTAIMSWPSLLGLVTHLSNVIWWHHRALSKQTLWYDLSEWLEKKKKKPDTFFLPSISSCVGLRAAISVSFIFMFKFGLVYISGCFPSNACLQADACMIRKWIHLWRSSSRFGDISWLSFLQRFGWQDWFCHIRSRHVFPIKPSLFFLFFFPPLYYMGGQSLLWQSTEECLSLLGLTKFIVQCYCCHAQKALSKPTVSNNQ